MGNIIRIKQVSHRLRWFFSILAICLPIVDALFWLSYNHLPASDGLVLTTGISGELEIETRFLLFMVSLIPITVATYGVFILSKLFRLYEKGIIFSANNVKFYRRLGYVIIFWVVAIFLYTPLSDYVVTMNKVVGERFISIGFELLDILTLIVGVIMILVSWIMDEGRKLEDQQSFTV